MIPFLSDCLFHSNCDFFFFLVLGVLCDLFFCILIILSIMLGESGSYLNILMGSHSVLV